MLIGRTIRRKMLNSLPPSTRAAWITESGMVSKKPLKRRKLKALKTPGRITAQGVSQMRTEGKSVEVPGTEGTWARAKGQFRVRRKLGINVNAVGIIKVPMKKMNDQRAMGPRWSLLLAQAANEVIGMPRR